MSPGNYRPCGHLRRAGYHDYRASASGPRDRWKRLVRRIRYFPELNFNQMVLKALFIGSPLARLVGLEERITPELVRMAEDYAAERRAAGRSVPEDIALITKHLGARHEAI